MTGFNEDALHRELALQSWTFAEQVFGDRFRVQEVLKQGQRVITLRGVDLVTDEPVVIKLVDSGTVGPGAQMRLEHAAGVMGATNNPSCCGFTHSGQQDGLLYLVRPFREGVTLQQRLADKPLDANETVALGRSLMRALHEAHSRGILHLDIRPVNVIVDQHPPITQASLIDFGSSRAAELESSAGHEHVAAACYMSPEQAGLLDQDVDETADLYAAGVVLFECLAGQPLFNPTSVGEVLRQQMTSPPPELRTLGLAVPRSLDEVIQRLVRKDPRDRYQSAEAVAADLALIAEGLQRGESEPLVVAGLRDRRRTLTEPAFVGRRQELDTLHAQLQRSRRGQNRLVFLEAESGGGKSRLLQEFMQRCVQQGTWVLRGQGLDQAAQRPFQMLTGIAAGLIADTRQKPALADKVHDALGHQRDAVCASLPELEGVFRAKPIDIGPETFAETRSLQALSVLLDALGAAGNPVVLLLDDCQWADQLTLKVLRDWQRRHESQTKVDRGGVLVVAAFRSEEVSENHELRSLRPSAQLTLPEFQTADVRQLVESMAGPLPDEAVDLIERLADGNPFMASAALRGLVESGALVAADDGWLVEPLAMSDVQSSRHAAALLARRIELLPEPSIRLLSVGAVLGKEFDLYTAATLAELAKDEAIAALDEARHRHIVWAKMQDNHCAFMHDKLRETLLDRLPKEERRELHLQAALDLEKQEPLPVFELAYHFDSAGESQRALPYALAAAEQARTQHSLEVAEQQYRIAGHSAPAGNRTMRCQIAEGLGDVLMLRGKYAQAAEQFETVRQFATGANALASIEGKIGELAFKRGNNKAAAEALERSLRLLGRRVPSRTAGFLLFLAWEVFVQTAHSVFPKWFLARRSLEDTDEQFLAIRLYTRLLYAYFFERGKVPCLWAHLRAMNLAERYPPTPELGHAWATHAPVMALLPWLRRGEVFAKKSFEVRKELGDLWGQGQSLNYWGVLLSVGSRFDDCIIKFTEAVRLLQRTGDFWEVHIARYLIADAIYRKGDLPTALAQAKRLYKSAHEMGDDKVSGFVLDVWSRASGGQLPADIVQREMQKERHDVQATVQVLLAEGVRRIGQDDFAGAAEILTRAQKVCGDVGMKNDWVGPVWPWKATALRLQWQKSTDVAPQRRRQLLADTRKAARQAIALARKFRTDLPHALREAGLVELMWGKVRRGRKYLDESLKVAEQLGLKLEHAQTLLARGRAGLTLGWPGAADDVAAARLALIELGADFALDEPTARRELSEAEPVTLSLADRFDTVLESGRHIASALTRESIYTAVQDAALKLLRGEECVVLQMNSESDEEAILVSGEIAGEFCPLMVRRAMADSRAVTYTEGAVASEDVSEALLLSGVRSALCAPILVRGRGEACMYVTHRRVSGLFGENEQRLAEFIATIAGAALENAEGFAKLQQLTETLEQRVQQRTSALEASNIELQHFAYVASHDLQTPLRGITGFAQLLQKDYQGKLDEKADDYIEWIVEGAKRMKQLIDDLLAYSAVESRSAPFEPTNLSEVFDDAAVLFRESMGDASQLTRGELPSVSGDRSQLSQLLQNLIGNAVKYHGDQPPQVHVSAENSGGQWTIAVRDNGIGIAAKQREEIFEIFRRLHTADKYPGTGIGLAICRRVVQRHGGKIWVESLGAEGSTFYFTIPEWSEGEGGAAN